ncbi:hypothetical protein MRX96_006209 [Rhipicephalus microplus]
MGPINIALVTFEGLKVPRYVRIYGALHPTPDAAICPTCGTDNPTKSHPCTPHCKSCDKPHPTTDPNCPRRERQVLNKAWVWKALENELRELKPSSDHSGSSMTAETRHSRTPTKTEEWRSKSRSKSRHKSNTRSKIYIATWHREETTFR